MMKKVENSKKKIVLIGIIVFIQAIFCNTIFSLGANNSKEQVIEEGTYIIKSSIDDKYVLDVLGASKENGTNVALYEYHASSQHQKFQIKYLGNGYYKIAAIHSNKVLDVEGSGTRNETNVEQFE